MGKMASEEKKEKAINPETNFYIKKARFKIHENEGHTNFKGRLKQYFEEGLKNKKALSMIDHSVVIPEQTKISLFDFRLYEEFKMLDKQIAEFVQGKRQHNFTKNEQMVLENLYSIGRIRKRMEDNKTRSEMGKMSTIVYINKNGLQKVEVADFKGAVAHTEDIIDLGRKNRININKLRFLSEHEKKLNEGFRNMIKGLYNQVDGLGKVEAKPVEEYNDVKINTEETIFQRELKKANEGR